MLSKKNKIWIALGLSFVIWLALDILTKRWAVSEGFKAYSILGDWLYLIPYQKNEGIAFSLPVPRLVQIAGSSVILFFLAKTGLKYLLQSPLSPWFPSILLGMVFAGGLGNLLERLVHGYVVDFIVLGPIPVFNIADIGITVGLILLFATMLVAESKNKNERKTTSHL